MKQYLAAKVSVKVLDCRFFKRCIAADCLQGPAVLLPVELDKPVLRSSSCVEPAGVV